VGEDVEFWDKKGVTTSLDRGQKFESENYDGKNGILRHVEILKNVSDVEAFHR